MMLRPQSSSLTRCVTLCLGAGRQQGVGLIELLIAITITLLLSASMISIIFSTKANSTAQINLAQLQDDQRLAINMLNTIIQQAGYFPNPTVNTPEGALLAANTALPDLTNTYAQFKAVGDALGGADAYANGSDSIGVQFVADGLGGMMDCAGNTTIAANTLVVSSFSVDANNNLLCLSTEILGGVISATGSAQKLAGNVSSFNVLYLVDTSSQKNRSKLEYFTATAMTKPEWKNVVAVKAQLVFKNPLFGQAAQPATLPEFDQVIPVPSRS